VVTAASAGGATLVSAAWFNCNGRRQACGKQRFGHDQGTQQRRGHKADLGRRPAIRVMALQVG
jgi:hypothetical protein